MSPRTPHRRFARSFFGRSPDVLARALLGKLLVHRGKAGVIVEAEAYLAEHDLASHARFGPTDRNRVMFGPGGMAYVYLCYGVHEMFNVVADRDGTAGAVLIRALAPLPQANRDPGWARGPGKLTRALGLSRAQNGQDLTNAGGVYVARGPHRVPSDRIARGPRVGVGYAGKWATAPLRYWIKGHPAVSMSPTR